MPNAVSPTHLMSQLPEYLISDIKKVYISYNATIFPIPPVYSTSVMLYTYLSSSVQDIQLCWLSINTGLLLIGVLYNHMQNICRY